MAGVAIETPTPISTMSERVFIEPLRGRVPLQDPKIYQLYINLGKERIEPSTPCFGNTCSTPLSYKPFVFSLYKKIYRS